MLSPQDETLTRNNDKINAEPSPEQNLDGPNNETIVLASTNPEETPIIIITPQPKPTGLHSREIGQKPLDSLSKKPNSDLTNAGKGRNMNVPQADEAIDYNKNQSLLNLRRSSLDSNPPQTVIKDSKSDPQVSIETQHKHNNRLVKPKTQPKAASSDPVQPLKTLAAKDHNANLKNQKSKKVYKQQTELLEEADRKHKAKQLEQERKKKLEEDAQKRADKAPINRKDDTSPEHPKGLRKSITSPVIINTQLPALKNGKPVSSSLFWNHALTATAYVMLFGAAIWGTPMVAKKLATVATSYGYIKASERILADEGTAAVFSLPVLICMAIYMEAKKSGTLLLLLTSNISAACAYKEGNIYPGILGITGAIIGAVSYAYTVENPSQGPCKK